MKNLRMLWAVMQGKAVVIIKRDANTADVVVGCNVSKRFALGSVVGVVKALML